MTKMAAVECAGVENHETTWVIIALPFKVRMLSQKLEYPRRIRKWPSALVYTPVRYLRTYTYTYTSQNDRSARTPNLRVRVEHEITDLPYTYTLLHIMHIIIMANPVVDKVRHGMWYTARYGVDLQFKRTMVSHKVQAPRPHKSCSPTYIHLHK